MGAADVERACVPELSLCAEFVIAGSHGLRRAHRSERHRTPPGGAARQRKRPTARLLQCRRHRLRRYPHDAQRKRPCGLAHAQDYEMSLGVRGYDELLEVTSSSTNSASAQHILNMEKIFDEIK